MNRIARACRGQSRRLLIRHLTLTASTLLCGCIVAAASAVAHSASDAYLTLSAGSPAHNSPGATLAYSGQWDVALRDLDFVLGLDENGDGKVTWREVKHHQAAIERYVYVRLAFSGGASNRCFIKPTRQLIDDHADGAYVALFFDVFCAAAPAALTMSYDLFFALDPSHRAIFVMHAGDNVSTALLSPQNSKIELKL